MTTKSIQHMRVAFACTILPLGAIGAEPPLQSVDVVGRRASGAYYATDASGTKTELSLRELPQAVRIMSRQSLDDLGALRIDDALDYVGGVSRQNSFGGMWDNIAIRGLAGDQNNGMAMLQNGFAANRGFNAPRDTANVERIEFLKGTSASLYGAGEPGGTLNVVTKAPRWRAAHAAEIYGGSHDLARVAIDSTGPLNNQLAYRVNAAVEEKGSFRDHIRSRRHLLAPALTWKISPGTRIDYRGELLRHSGNMDRGIVAVNAVLGAVPRERFLGEPGDGDTTVENQTHQLVLVHELGASWQLRAGLSHKTGEMNGFSTEAQPGLEADGRTLRRQRRYRDYASDDTTAQLELAGRFRTGGVKHELLVGVEGYRLDFDQRMLRANPTAAAPYAVDVFAPVYGQPRPLPLPSIQTEEDQEGRALVFQDAVTLGERWRLVAGARLDDYKQSLSNIRTRTVTRQSQQEVSPRAGLAYLASPAWSLFLNAGRSFRPNTGADVAGMALAPESGRSSEVGAKWENAERTAGATIALYDIVKRNAVTADPANPGFSIAAGEVSSRGMDADFSGQLSRAWRANASVSYIDASVKRDNTLEAGARLLNIPRLNAGVMLLYEGMAAGRRYGIGTGLTYSAKRLGEARTRQQANTGRAAFELPGYTVARLVAHVQLSPQTRLSLDIDNLFDRTYYTSAFQSTWVSPGPARGFVLGLQTKF